MVTGQLRFDSHIEVLLQAAVSLVNELTDGELHGKPYLAPAGPKLPAAAAAALPRSGRVRVPEQISSESAACLAETAQVMRAVFEAMDERRVDDAAAAINRLLRETGARPQLDRVAGEPWQMHFHGSSDTYGIGWSAGCATALALVVGSDLAGRLGVCSAPHCDRVYVDTSRNWARQFCSAACQSRVKAAAFRARQGRGASESA
jgi:predicted RNA-binding Zn ribbon-like protein